MEKFRFYLVLYVAKISSLLFKLFGFGAGYVWPGHLALKFFPNFLSSKYAGFSKIIIVSGTNGKTTTTSLISHLLNSTGRKVVHNKSGANLLNGIVSTILLDKTFFGVSKNDMAVFEIDEFNLPKLLKFYTPDVLVLLNLSRDQLDRYGEVDIIFDRWRESISSFSAPKLPVVIYDSSQPEFSELKKIYKGKLVEFSEDFENLAKTNLVGSFNSKNVSAAVKTCEQLGVSSEVISKSLPTFDAAFGRGEKLLLGPTTYNVFLAKNPASFNHNLKMLSDGSVPHQAVLVIFNDSIPDGRDVSWIYDVEPKLLESVLSGVEVFVSGVRAFDMAVRLSYAGVEVSSGNINQNVAACLKNISAKNFKSVVVLPNYSAMLDFRKAVLGRKIL